MFKRRTRQPWGDRLRQALWPRRGWSRALHYLRLRLNRIPDSPGRIARGVAAGVLASFTPFFGFHLFLSAGFAWALRGNVVASLIGSLFGNPVTIPLIAVGSLGLGRWILGHHGRQMTGDGIVATFGDAFGDIAHNVWAIFTGQPAHWAGLAAFVDDILIPYLVGGVLPGAVCAFLCYLVSLRIISAYQARRRARLRKRLEAIRAKIDHRAGA